MTSEPTADDDGGELNGSEELLGESLVTPPFEFAVAGPAESDLTGAEQPVEPAQPAPRPMSDAGTHSQRNWLLMLAMIAFLAAFACYLSFQIQAFVSEVAAVSVLWAGIFVIFAGVAIGGLAWYCGRVVLRYWSMREIVTIQTAAAEVLRGAGQQSGSAKRLRPRLANYLDALLQSAPPSIRPKFAACRSKLDGDISAVLHGFETEVLVGCLDPLVRDEIEAAARRVGWATAMAPKQFDGVIIFWNALQLVDRVSAIYSGRPDRWGTALILYRAARQIIIGGLVSEAAAAVGSLLSSRAAIALGGRIAEGATNALLMLRFGEALRQTCRPIEPKPVRATDQARQVLRLLRHRRNIPHPPDLSPVLP